MSVLLFHTGFAFSQNKPSIEVTTLIRYDNYGTFNIRYGNSVDTQTLILKGTSWGLNGRYRIKMFKTLGAKIAVGYYKYTFNNIKNTRFGHSDNSRSFDYPSPNYVVFATNKYWYNCVNLNFGIEKRISLKDNYEFFVGVNFSNHFTYSQKFCLPVDAAIDPPYKRYDYRFFGFSSTLNFGIDKEIKRIYLGTHFLLPLFDNWKLDEIFRENTNDSRHKWFNGIGGELAFGYYLKH